MKPVTQTWLKVWGYILLAVGGIPTFGFTWCVIYALDFNDPWQIKLTLALEMWLHRARQVGLILLGFPTLGYTWFWVNRFEEPCFLAPRLKYSTEKN